MLPRLDHHTYAWPWSHKIDLMHGPSKCTWTTQESQWPSSGSADASGSADFLCCFCPATSAPQVALRFLVLRKGYEFLLEAFAALAVAVANANAAARERGEAPRPAVHLTHVDQLWDLPSASSSSSAIQVCEQIIS